MFDRLINGAFAFAAGAVVGAAGVLWLMSDSGKEARGELKDLASQAVDKLQDCCEQAKQKLDEEYGKQEA